MLKQVHCLEMALVMLRFGPIKSCVGRCRLCSDYLVTFNPGTIAMSIVSGTERKAGANTNLDLTWRPGRPLSLL